MIAEVCLTDGSREHVRLVSFRDDAPTGQIACIECGGTGWWDYAPYAVDGAPCVDCKGRGTVPVGLS